MTQKKRQDFADKFTNEVMAAMFGEHFTNLEDVEDNEHLNKVWNYLNERFYETLTNMLYI